MMYETITRHEVSDHASIAHGMPPYRMVTTADMNRHIAMAHHMRGVYLGEMFARAYRAVRGLFGAGKTSAA